jgi:hypothetical protein
LDYAPFEAVLKSIWKDSFIQGFSIAEKNLELVKGEWAVKNIKVHSPHNWDIYTDQGFNIDYLFYRLLGTVIGRDLLPKFIVSTYPFVEHGNFYGRSKIQPIYFDLQVIEVLEQAQAEGVRRVSIRPIIHYWSGEDRSEADITKMRDSLFRLDSASVLSFEGHTNPESGKLEPQEDVKVLEDRASPDGLALIKDILDILYKRVSRILDMPDDLGFSVSTSVGSYAKSKEETNLLSLSITNDQRFIERIVNRQIVPTMVQINFPSLLTDPDYNLPVFRFGSAEEEVDSIDIENIVTMLQAGILDPKHDLAMIRDKLRLPAPASEMMEEEEMEPMIDEEEPEEEPIEEEQSQFMQKVKRFLRLNHGN